MFVGVGYVDLICRFHIGFGRYHSSIQICSNSNLMEIRFTHFSVLHVISFILFGSFIRKSRSFAKCLTLYMIQAGIKQTSMFSLCKHGSSYIPHCILLKECLHVSSRRFFDSDKKLSWTCFFTLRCYAFSYVFNAIKFLIVFQDNPTS